MLLAFLALLVLFVWTLPSLIFGGLAAGAIMDSKRFASINLRVTSTAGSLSFLRQPVQRMLLVNSMIAAGQRGNIRTCIHNR